MNQGSAIASIFGRIENLFGIAYFSQQKYRVTMTNFDQFRRQKPLPVHVDIYSQFKSGFWLLQLNCQL